MMDNGIYAYAEKIQEIAFKMKNLKE